VTCGVDETWGLSDPRKQRVMGSPLEQEAEEEFNIQKSSAQISPWMLWWLISVSTWPGELGVVWGWPRRRWAWESLEWVGKDPHPLGTWIEQKDRDSLSFSYIWGHTLPPALGTPRLMAPALRFSGLWPKTELHHQLLWFWVIKTWTRLCSWHVKVSSFEVMVCETSQPP
jgi:hypothetical protein